MISSNLNGLILIDKPTGWSSFDVIRKLKAVLSEPRDLSLESRRRGDKNLYSNIQPLKSKLKIGHSGTLDPMATGLLIVLVGTATKLQDQFLKQAKVYEAEITLGASSTTDDAEGEIRITNQELRIKQPSEAQIQKTLKKFTGEIKQMPPIYSALHINGQRAYQLARAGKAVKLAPRPITIHAIKMKHYQYPKLKIEARVSSGTYIRALARDIGQEIGTGAYLSGLRRTLIGSYNVKDALNCEFLKLLLIKRAIIPL